MISRLMKTSVSSQPSTHHAGSCHSDMTGESYKCEEAPMLGVLPAWSSEQLAHHPICFPCFPWWQQVTLQWGGPSTAAWLCSSQILKSSKQSWSTIWTSSCSHVWRICIASLHMTVSPGTTSTLSAKWRMSVATFMLCTIAGGLGC